MTFLYFALLFILHIFKYIFILLCMDLFIIDFINLRRFLCTELMLVTSIRTRHLCTLPTSITIGNAQIPFKQSMKNLGFILDCHLTMNAHVSNIARTCYFELRRLASIR